LDRYRFLLGFCLVVGEIILAGLIALGKVDEKSSFGLTAIFAILAKVTLDFSAWAFSKHDGPQEKDK
jgi:hypothetical protein